MDIELAGNSGNLNYYKSELGLHFSSLNVLLWLVQIEIIGGAEAPPPPRPPVSDGLAVQIDIIVLLKQSKLKQQNKNQSPHLCGK